MKVHKTAIFNLTCSVMLQRTEEYEQDLQDGRTASLKRSQASTQG